MSQRHIDALTFSYAGPVNPSGVAHTIAAACSEMLSLGSGTRAVSEDPAIRYMVYHLAQLCGIGPTYFSMQHASEHDLSQCRDVLHSYGPLPGPVQRMIGPENVALINAR